MNYSGLKKFPQEILFKTDIYKAKNWPVIVKHVFFNIFQLRNMDKKDLNIISNVLKKTFFRNNKQ